MSMTRTNQKLLLDLYFLGLIVMGLSAYALTIVGARELFGIFMLPAVLFELTFPVIWAIFLLEAIHSKNWLWIILFIHSIPIVILLIFTPVPITMESLLWSSASIGPLYYVLIYRRFLNGNGDLEQKQWHFVLLIIPIGAILSGLWQNSDATSLLHLPTKI